MRAFCFNSLVEKEAMLGRISQFDTFTSQEFKTFLRGLSPESTLFLKFCVKYSRYINALEIHQNARGPETPLKTGPHPLSSFFIPSRESIKIGFTDRPNRSLDNLETALKIGRVKAVKSGAPQSNTTDTISRAELSYLFRQFPSERSHIIIGNITITQNLETFEIETNKGSHTLKGPGDTVELNCSIKGITDALITQGVVSSKKVSRKALHYQTVIMNESLCEQLEHVIQKRALL